MMTTNAASVDYAADKDIWRKIYKNMFAGEDLDSSIEDQSIYWVMISKLLLVLLSKQ